MEKTYTQPQFDFVRMDASNKVFFTASGPTPGPTSTGGTLQNVGGWF